MLKRVPFFMAAACLAGSAWIAGPAMAQPASPLTGKIHRVCEGVGLDPGELGFTYCVMSLEASVDLAAEFKAPVNPNASSGPAADPTGPDSFFRSPPREQHARVGAACAALGFGPGSSMFRQCVGSLDQTLSRINASNGDN
jgi:hypothetical protein